ncbi:MAG: hypothetical protein WCH74_02255 [Chloroflexota bacterium]
MSPSASTPYPFVCVTCDLLIAGNPVFHVGLPFCCAGCVADGPCMCSYDVEAGKDHRGVSDAWAACVVLEIADELGRDRAEEREPAAVA